MCYGSVSYFLAPHFSNKVRLLKVDIREGTYVASRLVAAVGLQLWSFEPKSTFESKQTEVYQ